MGGLPFLVVHGALVWKVAVIALAATCCDSPATPTERPRRTRSWRAMPRRWRTSSAWSRSR
nr:hypothetical protein [Kofleriaceae bacterium]